MNETIKKLSVKFSDSQDFTRFVAEYQSLQEEILQLQKEPMTLIQYFRWRRRILPFLGKNETKGRHFLFDLAFVEALVCSQNPADRNVAIRVIINIIDNEFSHRIQEIGEVSNEGCSKA